MASSRRHFLIQSATALAATSFQTIRADNPPSGAINIRNLLAGVGFDPDIPNTALLAVIADVHINLTPGDPKYCAKLEDQLVAELNGLTPSLTDIAIAGDLIINHSVSIGGNRYPTNYELARQEYRCIRQQFQRFRPDARFWAVPGNHDTDRFEEDAELWREELQLPPYQKTTLGGVPVFFLNSGHAGMLNDTQLAWFQNEVASIPKTQEVLIVAHHPSFYYRFEETGLKRVVATAFRNHAAPIWLLGGHGHAFGEQMFAAGSKRFIQMEVTTGNPKQFGDSRSPGYALFGLQNGKMAFRAYRSVLESGFEIKSKIGQLKAYPLAWAFDDIQWPAVIFEEGFYNRTGKLVGFNGTDLKTHIILCKSYTVKVDLSHTGGKVTNFLLCANINQAFQAPTCGFSFSGLDGTWIEVPYPTPTNHGIYRIPIPMIFRNSPSVFVRTKSQLQGVWDGITVCGWGLEADENKLSGYEKWLATHYRTIFNGNTTSTSARPTGSTLTNLQHYAFQIPLPQSAAPITQQSLAQNSSTGSTALAITGVPVFSRVYRTVMAYRFARRKASSSPLASYVMETSPDLKTWTELEEAALTVASLDETWEEVSFITSTVGSQPVFCRTRVENQALAGSPSYIRAGDNDGDGMDDLLEYAFDLQASANKTRSYDPARPTGKAGIPIQSITRGIFNRLVFPRLRDLENSGVRYRILESRNLSIWNEVPANMMSLRVLRSAGDYDELEAIMLESTDSRKFYQVVLEPTVTLAT